MELSRWVALAMLFVSVSSAGAQTLANFVGARGLVYDSNPLVKISEFRFENQYDSRVDRHRFQMEIAFTGLSSVPVVAFESVVLKYDPFNRRLEGVQWIVAGKGAGDWGELSVGQASKDTLVGVAAEKVFTAIVYVRSVRTADGKVWSIDEADLPAKLKAVAPLIAEIGSVRPDGKQPPVLP